MSAITHKDHYFADLSLPLTACCGEPSSASRILAKRHFRYEFERVTNTADYYKPGMDSRRQPKSSISCSFRESAAFFAHCVSRANAKCRALISLSPALGEEIVGMCSGSSLTTCLLSPCGWLQRGGVFAQSVVALFWQSFVIAAADNVGPGHLFRERSKALCHQRRAEPVSSRLVERNFALSYFWRADFIPQALCRDRCAE